MKNTKRKKLPTDDIAEFDDMLRISFGKWTGTARIGRCDVNGLLEKGPKNEFGRRCFVYRIYRFQDLTLGNDGSCDRFRDVAEGVVDGSKPVAMTIFKAAFRAVCKCVYHKQLKPMMPKGRASK